MLWSHVAHANVVFNPAVDILGPFPAVLCRTSRAGIRSLASGSPRLIGSWVEIMRGLQNESCKEKCISGALGADIDARRCKEQVG
jgi:hypothetical protein